MQYSGSTISIYFWPNNARNGYLYNSSGSLSWSNAPLPTGTATCLAYYNLSGNLDTRSTMTASTTGVNGTTVLNVQNLSCTYTVNTAYLALTNSTIGVVLQYLGTTNATYYWPTTFQNGYLYNNNGVLSWSAEPSSSITGTSLCLAYFNSSGNLASVATMTVSCTTLNVQNLTCSINVNTPTLTLSNNNGGYISLQYTSGTICQFYWPYTFQNGYLYNNNGILSWNPRGIQEPQDRRDRRDRRTRRTGPADP